MTDPAAWGVAATYRDAWHRTRRIPRASREAVVAAMGMPPGASPDDGPPVHLVARGGALPVAGEVVLEDGTSLGRLASLPADVPYGYHALDGQLLIVAPARCHLPRGLRDWGWATQLYAARSAGSWGIGDFADLTLLAETAAGQGARFVTVSPTWVANPGPFPEPSPYFPSSRRMHAPLYLRVEEVSGAEALGTELVRLAAAGRALNGSPRIDRAAVQELKLRALRAIWEAAGRPGVPESFRAAAGAATLRRWATFAVLSEELGPGWHGWEERYREPTSGAVARFGADHAARVAFHEWLQWQIDRQRATAGAVTRIINDLPIGADPQGFDAWDWQATLARGATIGAPPDRFNQAGQDWSLPAFVPHRLREAGFRPFIETVRAGLRHAGGLRIDHVLGLFRMWWIPAGSSAADGAYVRYPIDAFLAILAIESVRAGAVIVGEDLGTVPRGVRSRLAAANVLSMRLLYFEKRPPASYPRKALAGITTHDLPTLAGVWSGSDLDDQAAAGVTPDPSALELLHGRVATAAGIDADASLEEASLAAHRAVAASPAALVAATLEDAFAVAARPNIPGTLPPARDNWSVALPRPIEELKTDRFVARLASTLRR